MVADLDGAGNLPTLEALLESAARLQQLVPDAVLVGGAAVAFHVQHRLSTDHDHVVTDLKERFDVILDALEREGDWVTNRATYGKIILGELGDIEAGVRQLIRARPLEVEQHRLSNGSILTVPTADETLRVKAFLLVKRNQTRDYLDVAALGDKAGVEHAGGVLARIDEYYADQAPQEGTVAAQVIDQLADPKPKDASTTRHLSDYKGLVSRWTSWSQVTLVCKEMATAAMLTAAAVDRPAEVLPDNSIASQISAAQMAQSSQVSVAGNPQQPAATVAQPTPQTPGLHR